MQHAGIQYGQGAANSHQSPPFPSADVTTNGGNTTSSLRQFRKKDPIEKPIGTDLNKTLTENIARVPPHNHYPANDYYFYHQYPEYNTPFKEQVPSQVKYSEIAEASPPQHVDHLQKPKEPHSDFMNMCKMSQTAHMNKNYPENLSRQQGYVPEAAATHHQYLKEQQVHPGYKQESPYISKETQYHQQYQQKCNIQSQLRKYTVPSHDNELLAKLHRLNPSIARSIMSDHHIRETQVPYQPIDQSRVYHQNQRYYPPPPMQNNTAYNYHGMTQGYNYASCNYKPTEYPRTNQMPITNRYSNTHSDRSISPRRYPDNISMPINYGATPQKISPTYPQYNAPEYAQHYQHRRTSMPQDYYQQQPCRPSPYIPTHQISPEPNENRTSSGLRQYLENWAEEETPAELFKDNIRIHNEVPSNSEPVIVINSSDIPQGIENVSLVSSENVQYIIKASALDNSVVRIKETTVESNGERTVNLQIVEAPPKSDCVVPQNNTIETHNDLNEFEGAVKALETNNVPYISENQNQNHQNKDCNDTEVDQKITNQDQCQEKIENTEREVIISPRDNEVSVIKDMPLIEDDIDKQKRTENEDVEDKESDQDQTTNDNTIKDNESSTLSPMPSRRIQRIFSVDDIINNIGSSPTQFRRSSLQITKDFATKSIEDKPSESEASKNEEESAIEEGDSEVCYKNAISVDNEVILEIGGALVQLNINFVDGNKVLSVQSLSEPLIIDVNSNCQEVDENIGEECDMVDDEKCDKVVDDVDNSVYESEIVIGEEEVIDSDQVEIPIQNEVVEEFVDTTTKIADSDQVEIPIQNEVVGEIAQTTVEQEIRCDDVDQCNKEKEKQEVAKVEVIEEAKFEDNKDIALVVNNEESVKAEVADSKCNTKKTDIDKKVENEDTKRVAVEVKENKDQQDEIVEIIEKKDVSGDNLEGKRQPIDEIFKDDNKDGQKEKITKTEKKDSSSDDKECKKQISEAINKIEKKDVSTETKDNKQQTSEAVDKIEKKEANVENKDSKKPLIKELKVQLDKDCTLSKLKKESNNNNIKESKRNPTKKAVKEKERTSPKALAKSNQDHIKISKSSNQDEASTTKKVAKEDIKASKKPKKLEEIKKLKRSQSDSKEVTQSDAKLEKISKKSRRMSSIEAKETPKKEEKVDKIVIKKARRVTIDCSDDLKVESTTKSDPIEKSVICTKAAKKIYETPAISKPKVEDKAHKKVIDNKKSISKLEETVNKIKSMKEKANASANKETKSDVDKSPPKTPKRVSFNIEIDDKRDDDKKKLSWEEYSSRKRKNSSSDLPSKKIMEDTVTSSNNFDDEVVEQVELSIENEISQGSIPEPIIKKPPSPKKVIDNSWEDEVETPSSYEEEKHESIPDLKQGVSKCIIDINEFDIKPMESSPNPVTSTYSYNQESDLKQYKEVVDSKLNSLNIKIPKLSSKPKIIEADSSKKVACDIIEKLMRKSTLNDTELEQLKKIIEYKRKIENNYEVRDRREFNNLKMQFRKVETSQPKRKRKQRFRNLYTDETSDDDDDVDNVESDNSDGNKVHADYSVFQRDSQGVPKLIFKRKPGLPQPFVKLERSQALEMMAKKRKLY